jgi:BirA family biotin operon repressor/biotin-[acetyl-CoA-carboxylase] ligase
LGNFTIGAVLQKVFYLLSLFSTVRSGTFTLSLFKEPLFVEEVSSTQDVVKAENFPHFTPLVANRQSGGRGRKGSWFSPPEGGLYLSVKIPVKFFNLSPEEVSPLSLAVGYAVSNTVDRYFPSLIKWPNDVYIAGKKVAGVLIEVSKGSLVVGIGVNLNIKDFPSGIKPFATSLYLTTGWEVDKSEFLSALLENLSETFEVFKREGLKPFVGVINRKLLWRGKRVLIDNRECGMLLGVNERGEAVVKTCFGKLKHLTYGDISLRSFSKR